MSAKEYLTQIQRIQTIIEQKQERINQYRQSITSVQAVNYRQEKVQNRNQADRTGDNCSRLADLEAETQRDIYSLFQKQNKIIQQIQGLKNPNHIKLLYKRYAEGKTLKQAAKEMSYSEDYTRELHIRALKAFGAAHKESIHQYNLEGMNHG